MNTSVDRERAARMLMRVEKGAFASRLLASIRSAGVRTRGITRFQLTSITNGAISNPSVSATEPCLFRSFPLAPLCRRLQVPHELMARGVYREQLVLLVDDAAVHRVIEDTFAR